MKKLNKSFENLTLIPIPFCKAVDVFNRIPVTMSPISIAGGVFLSLELKVASSFINVRLVSLFTSSYVICP